MLLPKESDYTSWRAYLDNVDELGELTALEKAQAKGAFRYLERALGPEFLSQGYASSKPLHPFFALLLNFAPWTRQEITRFAHDLHALESCSNFAGLLARLKRADSWQHDLLVVDSAARLVRDGLDASFEPALPVTPDRKQPDVKIGSLDTAETLFLEAAILESSRSEREAWDAANSIVKRLMMIGPSLRWAGQLFKVPAPLHLEELLHRLELATQRALEERGFEEVVEGGTIQLAVCHEERLEVFLEWCKEKGYSVGGFSGPAVDVNRVERLKRKIEREQVQLPSDAANAIIIGVDTGLFLTTHDFRSLIWLLEEEVYKHAHVALVIVRTQYIAGDAHQVISEGMHRYARRSNGLFTEENVILVNRFCSKKLSPSLLAKFFRAF